MLLISVELHPCIIKSAILRSIHPREAIYLTTFSPRFNSSPTSILLSISKSEGIISIIFVFPSSDIILSNDVG